MNDKKEKPVWDEWVKTLFQFGCINKNRNVKRADSEGH